MELSNSIMGLIRERDQQTVKNEQEHTGNPYADEILAACRIVYSDPGSFAVLHHNHPEPLTFYVQDLTEQVHILLEDYANENFGMTEAESKSLNGHLETAPDELDPILLRVIARVITAPQIL